MKNEKNHNMDCPNCQTSYDSSFKYCPECGQANKDLRLDFKYFINEFLTGMFNLDSKIFRTLKLLLFKPGKLSKEFISGKRSSYIPPVRLYLIGSLIYFTISSLVSNPVKITEVPSDQSDSKSNIITLDNLDSLQTLLPETRNNEAELGSGDSILERNLAGERLKKMGTEEGRKQFKENIMRYIPIGMFIFVPITAFILFILFRRNSYYIEHLIFVIHLQTLFYMIFTVLNLLELIILPEAIQLVTAALFICLLVIWVKKYYNVKWLAAVGKSVLFLMMYSFIFLFFFAIIAGISFFVL